MKTSLWHKARYWMLLLLVLLITISSHPTIMAMSRAAGMKNGTILSRYIILVFVGLFAMSLNVKSMLRPKVVRSSWAMWILIALFYLITVAFFGKKIMMGDLRSIAICLTATMIGWQLDLDEKRLHFLLLFYSGLILFVGLMQVFTNVGGFVILNQYETDNKNSLGVMLASGAVLLLFMGLNYKGKMFPKVILFVGTVLTLIVLLTIRARAATLSAGILMGYVFYERFKRKNFALYMFGGIAALVLLFVVLPESAKDFVYNSFFQNYEDGGDITTGRAERNIAALEFLSYHTFLGNLNQNEYVGWIHNYPLNRTFEFGVIFVFPILMLYLYLLINTIINTAKSDNKNTYNVGYYALLIPFIISMVEPTFPFGPGTATVINFLLFGVALRNTSNEKLCFMELNQFSYK